MVCLIKGQGINVFCRCNGCESRPKNSTNLDRNSSELYLQCSRVQRENNQEAWLASRVQVLNGAGVSGEGLKAVREGADKDRRQVRYQEMRPEKSAANCVDQVSLMILIRRGRQGREGW